jgi:hypothetical protein
MMMPKVNKQKEGNKHSFFLIFFLSLFLSFPFFDFLAELHRRSNDDVTQCHPDTLASTTEEGEKRGPKKPSLGRSVGACLSPACVSVERRRRRHTWHKYNEGYNVYNV